MPAPLLFLSAHLPVERSRQAGHKTAWRNLGWLAERHAVHLIAFRSEGDCAEPLDALRARCERLEVVDVTRGLRLQGLLRRPHLPLAVAARHSQAVERLIADWAKEIPYRRVHAEWSQLAAYFGALAAVPERTLYVHDVLSQWAARKVAGPKGWFWRWEAARTRRWEWQAYRRSTRLYVPSRKDEALIADGDATLRDRLAVLPLHFDTYGPPRPRNYGGPIRLLFWGALGRPENAESARWICQHVLPRLRAQGTDFQLVLAGSNPPADLAGYRGEQVEITGFIADPAEQFAQAHLAIAPLFQGAGVKVKVLECLAAGLPVLTTEIGSEGIEADAAEGLRTLPPDPEGFARAVAELSADRERLAGLAAAATAWGERFRQDHRAVLLA